MTRSANIVLPKWGRPEPFRTRHARRTRTTSRQIDPLCTATIALGQRPRADHIDSSLFVVSRASGKVAASPLLFSGGCYPPRSLSGVTTVAVSIGIWLMAAPEFDKGTLARTLIGPCGHVTGLPDRRQAYGPRPLSNSCTLSVAGWRAGQGMPRVRGMQSRPGA